MDHRRADHIEKMNARYELVVLRARYAGVRVRIYGFDAWCDNCDGPLPVQRWQGNPRRWCSEACRHRARRRRDRAERASMLQAVA